MRLRYLALATDYDGTLAWNGQVSRETRESLKRLRESGRKPILVTGRELGDLAQVFPDLDLFDRVIAENGAILYRPGTRERKSLGEPPLPELVEELRARGVPVAVGETIIATVEPHETTVFQTIKDLGLEHQVIFNKGGVMILPPTVNKGTGLAVALDELGLSRHNTVGIGDAENDHAFLATCECAVAVADALPVLKQRADYVTEAGEGAGVLEIIDKLVGNDLKELEPMMTRQDIPLGTTEDGTEVRIKPYGPSLLVAGPSGSGKSTTTMGILERLGERGYQFCLIDPEGDYGGLQGAITLGTIEHAPTPDEVLQVLQRPSECVVVNLTGLALQDRPAFFASLLPRLQELRAHLGRPHWIIVDEAHHLLPAVRDAAPQLVPQELYSLMMITIEPQHIAPAALEPVDLVIAVGQQPSETIGSFAEATGLTPPEIPQEEVPPGEVWVWPARSGRAALRVRAIEPRTEHLRHRRKYAEGDLGEERSFYFRGPEDKLNLRAQNLMLFMQLAEGLDDETWMHHLRRGDYSEWFRNNIKDAELADEAAKIEQDADVSPAESRKRIAAAIQDRYTAPA